MDGLELPGINDVQLNSDGTMKQSGKQSVKFYNKKRLAFKARPKLDADGKQVRDEKGKLVFDIDPKTGLPFKDAFEETVVMIRVETKDDTNIKDDIADDFSKRQFYRQYKHFMSGKIPEGNPIEDFDFLQPGTIMELHLLGISVIQQMSDMDDIECEQIKDQSGYEIRDIARQWVRINSPQGQASVASRLERENRQLKRELELATSRKGRERNGLVSPAQEGESVVEETPIATMEIPLGEKPTGRSGRPRKVQ